MELHFMDLSCSPCQHTYSLADAGSWIHLVAVVAFTFVTSFQVNADLTTDARVQALIDVCLQKEKRTLTFQKQNIVTFLIRSQT